MFPSCTHKFPLNEFDQIADCEDSRPLLLHNVFKPEQHQDLAELQVQIREGVPN
jgi:hypothetical protein